MSNWGVLPGWTHGKLGAEGKFVQPLAEPLPKPVSFWQVRWAFWKAADCGLMPLELPVMAPLLDGSGKLGTPWARMHLEYFSSWARFCGELALVPPPISRAQVFRALMNCGERVLMPIDGVITVPPLLDGSGKFGTPWLRMQAAKASPPDPLLVADGVALALLDGALATPGLAGLDEHATVSRPTAASPATAEPARHRRPRRPAPVTRTAGFADISMSPHST